MLWHKHCTNSSDSLEARSFTVHFDARSPYPSDFLSRRRLKMLKLNFWGSLGKDRRPSGPYTCSRDNTWSNLQHTRIPKHCCCDIKLQYGKKSSFHSRDCRSGPSRSGAEQWVRYKRNGDIGQIQFDKLPRAAVRTKTDGKFNRWGGRNVLRFMTYQFISGNTPT